MTGIHHENVFQLSMGANGVEFVELLAGGDYGNAAAGIGEEGGDLIACEGGVNGDVDGSDGQDGKIRNHPLPAILGNDGNAIAFFRSPAQERLSQLMDSLVDLIGRKRLPVIELILPENGAGIRCGGNTQEQVVDGGEWGWFHLVLRAVLKGGCEPRESVTAPVR